MNIPLNCFSKKNLSKCAALGLMASLPFATTSTLADETHGKRYAAVDVGFYSLDDDADITHINGRIGGFLNDNLALEGRLGTGLIDDEVNDFDISMRYMVGAYLRAGAQVNDNLFPYVLLGVTRADFEADGPGGSSNDAETDTSYGVGLDLDMAGLSLAFEYAVLIDKDGADYSGFSVGLKSTF